MPRSCDTLPDIDLCDLGLAQAKARVHLRPPSQCPQRSVSVHTPAVCIAGTGTTCFNVFSSQTVLPRRARARYEVACLNSPGSLDGPMSLSGTTQKLSSTAERSRDVRMSSNGQNRPSTLGPDHLRADKQASGGADLSLQKDGKPGKQQ